jgi:hypothetical protein
MGWRPRNEPDRYAGESGRKKGREEDGLWPVHRINQSEIFEMQQAGPTILEVNQPKDEVH